MWRSEPSDSEDLHASGDSDSNDSDASATPSIVSGTTAFPRATSVCDPNRQHAHVKRRRLYFASGSGTIALQVLNVLLSLLLVSSFWYSDRCERDGVQILPRRLGNVLCSCHLFSIFFAVGIIAGFFTGLVYAKTRVSFLDLLGCISFPLLPLFNIFDQNGNPDVLAVNLVFLIYVFFLSVALLIVPRKLKHRKRPNTFYSAFSVASTPASQCSSRPSLGRTLNHSLMSNIGEASDDRSSIFSASTAFTQSRLRSREDTPTREIKTRLGGLSLDCPNVDDDRSSQYSQTTLRSNSRFDTLSHSNTLPNVRSRFGKSYRPASLSGFSTCETQEFAPSNTATNSNLGSDSYFSSRSSFVSNPKLRAPRSFASPPLSFVAPSEFTSVSQREGTGCGSMAAWAVAVIAILLLFAQNMYLVYLHQNNAASSTSAVSTVYPDAAPVSPASG